MEDEAIEYKSQQKSISTNTHVLDTATTSGVKCSWSGTVTQTYGSVSLSWSFNWDELKNRGIDCLSGHIVVKPQSPNYFNELKIDVDLTESNQSIEKVIQLKYSYSPIYAAFEYSLIPHYRIPTEEVAYEEMFLPSDQNDAILVVEEKKLHVSKAFLSYHSDYFRALFSSNYKEGQMDEIPIEDISFVDFGLLASSFYPKTVFPNDQTVDKLLEMADRFMMTSVIGIVEYHLLHNTNIGNEKLMWLADKYKMSKLLEKSIRQMNTTEKAKKLKGSPECEMLSNNAKASVLDRLMQII